MSAAFSPASVRRFRFTGTRFDAASGVAELGYALDLTTGGAIELVEEIRFPPRTATLPADRTAAFAAALRLLHLVAGMSYFKAALPPEIALDDAPLGPAAAALLREVYLNGLAELAYRNGLDLSDRLVFPVGGRDDEAVALAPVDSCLVAIGGGKDSLVSAAAVTATGRPSAAAVVGAAPVVHRVAAATGLPVVGVGRRLAPALFELNRLGAVNGHVAITAIVSAILVATAVRRGDGAVVLSNERSASEGNLVRVGALEVNHQYSKSLAFERLLSHHLARHVVGGVAWFSLLRPLSELAVCRRFAALTHYHPVFTSCNANFKVSDPATTPRWCLACPKCRFVLLALAPFLAEAELVAVFGANPLRDAAAVPHFAALAGAAGEPKPFECVGTFAEARAALVLLARHPEQRDAAVVTTLLAAHPEWLADGDRLVAEALAPSPDHLVPAAFAAELDALLGPR